MASKAFAPAARSARSTIGSRMREARIARGLSQEDLGRVAGVSGFTISKYERGVLKSPLADTLERVALALGVEPAWLLHGAGGAS
jgi:transcriptional regulator with XRE-family HTH domain